MGFRKSSTRSATGTSPLGCTRSASSSKTVSKKNRGLHVLWFGEGSQFSAALYADMLEEVREYDPRAWNDYSKVNPPEGVLMRVECHDGSKACAQLRFFEREGFCRPEGLWCDIDGTPWPIADSDAVVRFRPWDDPDGEEDEE